MRKASLFLVVMAAVVSGGILFGSGSRNATANALRLATTPTLIAPEIPPDAKQLELDKVVTETIDPNTAIRFYTFTGKAGQEYRLTMTPKSGNFYSTLTIMTVDLQTIIGGTLGENLVSGSLVVRAPADGTYAISVEYADINDNQPASGSYEISISVVKPQ